MEELEMPRWATLGGPESVRHRLYVAAMGAGPKGHVLITRGLALDLVDVLRAADRLSVAAIRALRASEANVRLQRVVDAEQRAWRLLFLAFGFAAGSHTGDLAVLAWRWLHAG